MDRFGEQPKLEIRSAIEQKPFESETVRSFFAEWCEANSPIKLRLLSREQWNELGAGEILEKERPDGTQTLFVPNDLRLWEMVGVMEVVDKDTFAAKPEKAKEAKEKLLTLGKTFQDAGIYIAGRLDSIQSGRQIAEALALEFHEYGSSLASGARPKEIAGIEEIAEKRLTPGETEKIDRFLAGDALHAARQKRAATGPDRETADETERRRTLAQFFRAAEQAFALRKKSEEGELRESGIPLKPWQNDAPIHSAFLKRIERASARQIETPRQELEASIFRRGMELLRRNMPFDKLPDWVKSQYLHWDSGEETLREALRIDQLKNELDDVRKSGDPNRISAKEREIADKIQGAVSEFPYKSWANNPSQIIADQHINCAGASALGGTLMEEAGLTYLVGDVPRHSILLLVTSNGQVEWRDMLGASHNEALRDEAIRGRKGDGRPLAVADIAAFGKNPAPEGLTFDIDNPEYRRKLPWLKEGRRLYVAVFGPEYGQRIQILNNIGGTLANLGRCEEAIEVFRHTIAADPKDAYPYSGLGVALAKLDRYEEAIEAFREAIAANREFAPSYSYGNLGNVLTKLGRHEEAIEVYRESIAVDPGLALSYYNLGIVLAKLGRHEEAIEAYRKFLGLADEGGFGARVEPVKKIIKGLELSKK